MYTQFGRLQKASRYRLIKALFFIKNDLEIDKKQKSNSSEKVPKSEFTFENFILISDS